MRVSESQDGKPCGLNILNEDFKKIKASLKIGNLL